MAQICAVGAMNYARRIPFAASANLIDFKDNIRFEISLLKIKENKIWKKTRTEWGLL